MKSIKVVCPHCGSDNFFMVNPITEHYYPENYLVTWNCCCGICAEYFEVKEKYELVEADINFEEE